MKKGQASTEFLALVIIIMIISTAAYASISGRISNSESISGLQFACMGIADKINSALVFGSGFSLNMTVSQDYSTSIFDNSVVCKSIGNAFMEPVLGNVTNSTGSKRFDLKSQIRMENSNGIVIIY